VQEVLLAVHLKRHTYDMGSSYALGAHHRSIQDIDYLRRTRT